MKYLQNGKELNTNENKRQTIHEADNVLLSMKIMDLVVLILQS